MFHYLKTFSLVVAVQFIIAVCFNLLVDPYGAWHDIRIHGFNALKPDKQKDDRISKMGAWARHPTPNLILGSSRGAFGLDPDHYGFNGNVHNLALASLSLDEAKRLLIWLANTTQVKKVIFGTDFFAANMYFKMSQTYDGNFNYFRRLTPVTFFGTALSSLKTIFSQYQQNNRTSNWDSRDGSHYFFGDTFQSQHPLFQSCDSDFLNIHFLPSPAYQFSFNANGKSTEDYYRKMFALAHQKNIDLRVFISPTHARHMEVIYVLGLWPLQDEWLRIMVKVNEEEAARAGKAPFPLWDFSGFNSLTTEEVPPLGDSETRMKWYWESSHYKKELGDLVLDRVLDYSSPNRKVPADFGVLLDSKMLEAHLNQVRIDRDVWRKSHPEDVKEIAEMAAKAEAKRAFMKAKKKVPTAR